MEKINNQIKTSFEIKLKSELLKFALNDFNFYSSKKYNLDKFKHVKFIY